MDQKNLDKFKNKPNLNTKKLSFVVSIICFVLVALFTLLSTVIIFVDEEILNKPEFKAKYGSIYLNLNYRHRVNRVYNLVFIFRRVCLALYIT